MNPPMHLVSRHAYYVVLLTCLPTCLVLVTTVHTSGNTCIIALHVPLVTFGTSQFNFGPLWLVKLAIVTQREEECTCIATVSNTS